MNVRHVSLPLISAFILIFASCRESFFYYDGEIWGTTFHIVYDGDTNLDGEMLAEMRAIDAALSMFNEASEVSAVNRNETDSVSRTFADVFAVAKCVNALSGGVYDPTVAPLVDLWGFGRREAGTLPSESEIAAALESVGIAYCSVGPDNRLVKKTPATAFDFSSVAKGYGVDVVAAVLENNGVENYMVEIGGEVVAHGVNPKGKPWRIQIDAPVASAGHTRLSVVELGPDLSAVASSGNYRRFRTDSVGNIFGHTISPLTGRPVAGKVLASTVRAESCAVADALATACMAAAVPDSAFSGLGRADAEGLIVVASADTLKVETTPGW